MKASEHTVSLPLLAIGEKARVCNVSSSKDMEIRFCDLGVVPGTVVRAVLSSPGGNPRAYLIMGSVIAIRNEDARGIMCERIQ